MSLFGMFREPRLILPALTRTAQGQECTMRVPGVCNGRSDTTVWAHSNQDQHGKGKGLKAHDVFGCWACSACHDWYDRERDPSRHEVFNLAHARTFYILFRDGKLKVKP